MPPCGRYSMLIPPRCRRPDEAAQNGTPTTSTPFRIGGNNNNGTAGSFYGGAIAEAWVGREFITASRANQIAA